MKIVIDIDEKDKRYIDGVVDNSFLVKPTVDAILNAVRNGTTTETSMHHFICAWCDNEKCVKGTKECEFEQWKKKQESEEEE